MEPSTAYHAQTDGQSEIVNKEIIQVARACKAEGNEFWSTIPEIQLRLNWHYNAFQGNNPLVTVLGFNTNLGLDIFPYCISKYQSATERHDAFCQALTNTKSSQAKQANLHRTLKPQHEVGEKVLLYIKNIHIKHISPDRKSVV